MTFTRLLELYKDCGGTKTKDSAIYRLTDYGLQLFNMALNTNYFNRQTGLVEITRMSSPNGGLNTLTVRFANMPVLLQDCGEDAVTSYKSHTVELLMTWLVKTAGIARIKPFPQVVADARNSAIVNLALFDPYALRQLLKQDFDNPAEYYVCSLRYTSLFIDPNVNNILLMTLENTASMLLNPQNNYDGKPGTAWNVFWQNCTVRGLASKLKLTADDRQSLSEWLDKYFNPQYMHGEDTYDYKTNALNACLENQKYRLWGRFCASVAKRIIHPRCNKKFRLEC